MIGAAEHKPAALAFGPYQLDLARRRLTQAGRPVALGSRALDLLIALLEHPGELVTKSALTARAWPGVQVEDSNLRVQMSALRRALGDESGHAYIVAEWGRGYRFVAPLEAQPVALEPRPRRLPAGLASIVGRDEDVSDIRERLADTRLLTIVGPGGIGKTTLSLACARSLEHRFADGAVFVEVTEAADPALALAAALGLRLPDEAVVEPLTQCVAPLELLVVLDSCEYAIDETARLAEAILAGSPKTVVLATSREPMQAEGETVWLIEPLALPPDDRPMSADEVLDFAAVRLFVDRAFAADRRFRLVDADVGLVSRICRRLDGLPLAITLAAGRLPAFGLAGLAAALEDRLQAPLQGRRTSAPRLRSLAAAIDWSYDALSEIEQQALCRLSLFQGPFTADAAAQVLFGQTAGCEAAHAVLTNLVAKSLVVSDLDRTPIEYRLLDTTRDYARRKLEAAGELSAAAASHATAVTAILSRADVDLETRPKLDWIRYFSRQLHDVRAALDWSSGPDGDAPLAVRLTLAATPIWMRLVRYEEAGRRIETALGIAAPESADEMALDIALAQVVLMARTVTLDDPAATCRRAIELAIRLKSPASEFRATWSLWNAHIHNGYVSLACEDAIRLSELVSAGPASPQRLIAERAIGATEFLGGNLSAARSAIERIRSSSKGWRDRERLSWYAYDPDALSRNTHVHLLWLEGKPDSAIAVALGNAARALMAGNDNITPAVLADSPCLMAVMAGDDEAAERYLELLEASLRRGGPPGFGGWAKIVRAVLAARRGDSEPGLALLSTDSDVDRAHPRRVNLLAELAEQLGHAGARGPAKTLADALFERVQHRGELWILGEIQRVRAQLCADDAEARQLLDFAVGTARAQGALAWELRAATNLAQRWPNVGRPLLTGVLEKYTEGHWTRDVIAARQALEIS